MYKKPETQWIIISLLLVFVMLFNMVATNLLIRDIRKQHNDTLFSLCEQYSGTAGYSMTKEGKFDGCI